MLLLRDYRNGRFAKIVPPEPRIRTCCYDGYHSRSICVKVSYPGREPQITIRHSLKPILRISLSYTIREARVPGYSSREQPSAGAPVPPQLPTRFSSVKGQM